MSLSLFPGLKVETVFGAGISVPASCNAFIDVGNSNDTNPCEYPNRAESSSVPNRTFIPRMFLTLALVSLNASPEVVARYADNLSSWSLINVVVSVPPVL